MIFKGSRYEKLAKVPIIVVTPDGRQHAALPTRFIPRTPATFQHQVNETDRLDLLAYRYYRNQSRFWLIADANSAVDPHDLLRPGAVVLIPPDRGS